MYVCGGKRLFAFERAIIDLKLFVHLQPLRLLFCFTKLIIASSLII